MSNKYCNLVGSQKIRDEYTKINTGFDSVEADIVQSNTETANHFAGTGNRHTTAHITNGSGVIGETAEAALDTLKGQYENMVTGGASNTAIGVFSVVASGTDTISGTYSGLSALFGGLKVNLQIADTNTGAATFNLNSLGAKSIKKVTALGIKMPLNGAEMTKGGICQFQYDGTDWILIGAKLPYYATPKEATSSIINLGSDAKGTFVATVYGQTKMNIAQDTWATSLDGWTASGNVQSIVSNKYRLTNTSGAYGLRPLSLDLTKYYLITVYGISNSDTDGAKMAIVNANTGYADIKASSVLTKAQSSRIGVILQPSELTGTSPVLALYSVGNGYAEYYQFFIQEISATEYSEGLNVVMARYHYRTNGVLSTNGVTMSSVRRNKLNLDKAVADTNVSKITVQSDSIIVTPSAADARIKIPCKLSAGSYIPTIISGSTMIARNSSDANVSNSANDGVVMNVTAETSYIYWYLSNSNTNPITLYKNAIQLEPGTSKTPVEPYNVTTATIPVELKSVNVVQDEFSDCDWLPDGTPVLLGYWRHTQRVEVAANVASGTAINTANFPLAKNGSTFDLYLTAGGKQTGIVGTDTASGAGTLYYELVVPIVSKIEGVPNIDVYPGGSIYVEPVIEEEQRPTAGVITIKNTSLPIKLVRYVKEVTILPDGSRQYKDVSWTNTTTTISPTGADNTKFYLYAYERDSSLPKIKYSYGINESALMQDTAKGLTALSQSVAEFAEFAVAFFVNIEARLTAKGI